ncbi:hypothetical protein H0O00_05470 [Candidatus Micrarchaeota archaeon]|nr:hypothetical protein [Candidatus Micrarchaeota archaeon]
MTSHKIMLLMLLALGIFSAFNVADYLYPEETNATVAYTNFTLEGTDYSIVKIANVDNFLLADDAPITDSAEMETILHSYYIKTYYPSDDDITELRDLIKTFNDSRNDGYDFKNKEEYSCRDEVLLSNGKITVSGEPVICRDNESCTKNAMLLFSVYGEGLGLGSATAIITPLMEFTPSSLRMDDLLANYTTMLDNMSQENVVSTLAYMEDTSGELETLSKKIEGTIFRTPRLNDSADRKACQLKCWAICPSFDLDQDAAQQIKEKATDLHSNLGPLSDYSAVAATIASNTATRMEQVKASNTATYYSDMFKPLNRTGQAAIGYATETLVHVQNKSLSQKLDDLKSLYVTIPEDIQARNFATMDADINQYKQLSADITNMSDSLITRYNATRDAKNTENSLMLVLQSKDLDSVSMKSLQLLQNQTDDLNAQFRDGLTLAQLQALEGNYSALTAKAQGLLKSESDTPASQVLLLFRGFARRVNTGIATVVEKTDMMPRESVPTSAALGGFSVLVFLSFASMALLLFLHIFSTTRFIIPRTGHILGAAFLVLLLLIFTFTAFMYLFLGKTATDASLPEFLADFSSKSSSSIVVDLRNASFADANAMTSCASSLADSFAKSNRDWTIYTLTDGKCAMDRKSGESSNSTVEECITAADADQSAFMLGYSETNQPPRFSIIYDNKAEILANTEYYDSCPLVALFS